MDVRVHSRHHELSSEVRSRAISRVAHAGRILEGGVQADVEFTSRRNPRQSGQRYRVEITSRVAGHTVRVEADAADDRAALDRAVGKFERQLRRLKERLVARSRPRTNKPLNPSEPVSDEIASNEYDIVRTKRFEMRPMMPEEAALEMDMIGHSFFFFLDAGTGKHSVIYHRDDGSLGLIEPQ